MDVAFPDGEESTILGRISRRTGNRQETTMMTIERPKGPSASPDPGIVRGSDEARYLRWVAERVRGEDFWMA